MENPFKIPLESPNLFLLLQALPGRAVKLTPWQFVFNKHNIWVIWMPSIQLTKPAAFVPQAGEAGIYQLIHAAWMGSGYNK